MSMAATFSRISRTILPHCDLFGPYARIFASEIPYYSWIFSGSKIVPWPLDYILSYMYTSTKLDVWISGPEIS